MTKAQIERRRRKRKNKRLLCCIMAAIVFIFLAVLISPKPFKASHYITYEVCPGDTLWSVAKDTYGEMEDVRYMIDHISYINGIESGRIYPGQALSLPMKDK